MTNQNKRLLGILFAVAFLLFIPLIAMQFTDEVNWNMADFILMGIVLLVAGLSYELVARRSEKSAYRDAFIAGLAGAFLLFWVNGAVGIIGGEGQSANLMYGAVFAVGLIGSLISRFRPLGMARTLFLAAIVQMLIPVAALIIWPPPVTSWAPSVFGVFMMNAFFAALFVLSAVLFRRAGAQ